MNPKFKKLALAASITAGLGAAAMPAQAMLVSEAGEALLVPLFRHGGDQAGATNTFIKVTVPDTVGFDTVPNIFTAPNTTPTNPAGPTLFPRTNGQNKSLHWYWFDFQSVHRLNGEIPVTPGDVIWIDWLLTSGGAFAGQAGYMVIGTETARTGAAADFAMFGDAWYEIYGPDPFGSMVPVPVLPMIDGADGAFDSRVSTADNVKYNAQGIPRAVSPLWSGMRTDRADGVQDDTTVFNLSLGDRNFPSVHVVWLDTNTGYQGLSTEVWDSDEHVCSDSVDLPYELNYVRVAPWYADPSRTYCIPVGAGYNLPATASYFGYVSYFIPEYVNFDNDAPNSAGVAFAITMDWDADNQLRFTAEGGQVRGTYK